MNHSLSCASVVAQTLQAAGVRYVFGHPGGEVVDLIEALAEHQIEFILTGHEAAAAFMASAVGRLTGFPGVCLATLGPGACNLLLGVGCAYLDRDPILAITARTATNRAHLSHKQNLPLNEIFTPISKWSVALSGSGTRTILQQAISLAQSPPRGPVYLTLPADVAVRPEWSPEPRPLPPPLPSPNKSDFEAIEAALKAAQRPIAIIGLALDPEKDTAAVRRFLAETGIPYVVMPQAKGVADEEGEGFLGAVASAAGDSPYLVEALRQGDCLLGIGFDSVESSQDWHFHRPVYSVANGPTGFDQYQPLAECTGQVGTLLAQLQEQYRGNSRWTQAEIKALRRQVFEAIVPPAVSGTAGLAPYYIIRTLQAVLPDDTLMTTDVGAHKVLLAQAWQARQPRSFLITNGLSAMGYGLPTALAAALLYPQRLTVCVIGDGGFGMMVQELETACRLGVTPLIVVFCDRSLAVIKVAQAARNIPYRGVDFGPVDWGKIAEGFGAKGVSISSLEALEQAVTNWLARPVLTVLAVAIDESLYSGLTY